MSRVTIEVLVPDGVAIDRVLGWSAATGSTVSCEILRRAPSPATPALRFVPSPPPPPPTWGREGVRVHEGEGATRHVWLQQFNGVCWVPVTIVADPE